MNYEVAEKRIGTRHCVLPIADGAIICCFLFIYMLSLYFYSAVKNVNKNSAMNSIFIIFILIFSICGNDKFLFPYQKKPIVSNWFRKIKKLTNFSKARVDEIFLISF